MKEDDDDYSLKVEGDDCIRGVAFHDFGSVFVFLFLRFSYFSLSLFTTRSRLGGWAAMSRQGNFTLPFSLA